MIEACGVSVDEFVRNYLSVIQPFTLAPFQNKRAKNIQNMYYLLELGYRVSIVIKVNYNNPDMPLVVSFHEDNVFGVSKVKSFGYEKNDLCAVLIESIAGKSSIEGRCCEYFDVNYIIQHGFVRILKRTKTEYYYNGVALIRFSEIESEYNAMINDVYNDILRTYTVIGETELRGHMDSIDSAVRGSSYMDFSIMSLGFCTANHACFLIDAYSKFTDRLTRTHVVEIMGHILGSLDEHRLKELKNALEAKFLDSPNELYSMVINGGVLDA